MNKYSIGKSAPRRFLGRHVLVEYYNCNPNTLNDTSLIKRVMHVAAKKSGATIVCENFHRFQPYGVSGVIVIMESHFTIHTWPEYRYAAVDLFSCGEKINPWTAFEYLKTNLKSKKFVTTELKRGKITDLLSFAGAKLKK